jgi:beta-glucosidase-like glycosyl hydrolase/CubicO group peptidase (beta-lactamase class C family)
MQAAVRKKEPTDPLILARRHWVDSVYNTLTKEERIGQLFMVAAYSGTKNYNEEAITKLVAAHQIGGVIFMQGGPARQAALTNKYQRMAQVPLLVSMDAEWGLGMRLDSVKSFPRQMMLGATRDSSLLYKMGLAIGKQCKRLGVHINFAPDVDVNNNAANPVINSRSFGEYKNWVIRLARAYMRGMQQQGVIACAKHFPGHGDTNVDSHLDLPLINKTVEQLDTLELMPFKAMIAAGVRSIMVAHLEVPALDTTPHLPTTLSPNVVTKLLRERMGYNGLVITDALGMQGVVKYFPAGEADLRAFIAGTDILLFSQDVPTAIAKISAAIDSGKVSPTALEISVKKILTAKYAAGLHTWQDIATEHIVEDLNISVDSIRTAAATNAITLVKDDNQILNKLNANMSIAYVGINADSSTVLYQKLKEKYVTLQATWLPKRDKGIQDKCTNMLGRMDRYDAVIVSIHNLNFAPQNNYGLSDEAVAFLAEASQRKNTMLVLHGNAYAMQYFCGAPSVLVGYEDDSITERIMGDVLLKNLKPHGKLPVTACIEGKSIVPIIPQKPATEQPKEATKELVKTMYVKDAGVVDETALDKMNLFLNRCVADGVFPGCRVIAARDGKIFLDKAYGYFTYSKVQAVDTETLYDLASCTKILATTLAIMRLYEEGKIDLNKTLGDYVPKAQGTNKANIPLKDLLMHQAGLKSWIPFYKDLLTEKGKIKKGYVKRKPTEGYDVVVTERMFLRNDYPDTIWNKIYASSLDNLGKSVYSDLDFLLLASVVEAVSGKPIWQYAEDNFYKPLGLKTLTYKPLTRMDSTRIAPTEMDIVFRGTQLQGYVHDPCAAMLGGVAGHAGLFGTAQDVAVVMQMLLNKGYYGKTRYFKPATVAMFTAYQSALNHRGLGFDKPATDANDGGPAGARTSAQAFGHQGFTGTCVWADPATGILFVFLSNRVHPSADNTKINKLNVRTLTQDYLYEAMGIPVQHDREVLYNMQVKK